MPHHFRAPLHLAGLVAWVAVALSLRFVPDDRSGLAWALALAWLLAFLLQPGTGPVPRHRLVPLALLQAALALALAAIDPGIGTAQVLLVAGSAQLAMHSTRIAPVVALAADVAFYLILRDADMRSPLLVATINFAFQAFAILCAHYARSAERARDRLALAHGDLLATRALLADSARDAERLRVARELHDVAGHKLTALMLNLRLLGSDPALARRDELRVAERMVQELLGDLRGVVRAMRDSRGLDLATALRALAAPMPRPALELDIADDVRVTDPAVAEALIRLVQEALTNAARHAGAEHLRVRMRVEAGAVVVQVVDDGHVRGSVREGSGLTGMRERITALGGVLDHSRTARGGFAIEARLPA